MFEFIHTNIFGQGSDVQSNLDLWLPGLSLSHLDMATTAAGFVAVSRVRWWCTADANAMLLVVANVLSVIARAGLHLQKSTKQSAV